MPFVVTEQMIEVAAAALNVQDLFAEPGRIMCEIWAEAMLKAVAEISETPTDQGSVGGP